LYSNDDVFEARVAAERAEHDKRERLR